ncbi:unnamed protein product [Closterium sp. NIES-65]|nr:unnamed protein product [Closterium sp. NIES-65]
MFSLAKACAGDTVQVSGEATVLELELLGLAYSSSWQTARAFGYDDGTQQADGTQLNTDGTQLNTDGTQLNSDGNQLNSGADQKQPNSDGVQTDNSVAPIANDNSGYTNSGYTNTPSVESVPAKTSKPNSGETSAAIVVPVGATVGPVAVNAAGGLKVTGGNNQVEINPSGSADVSSDLLKTSASGDAIGSARFNREGVTVNADGSANANVFNGVGTGEANAKGSAGVTKTGVNADAAIGANADVAGVGANVNVGAGGGFNKKEVNANAGFGVYGNVGNIAGAGTNIGSTAKVSRDEIAANAGFGIGANVGGIGAGGTAASTAEISRKGVKAGANAGASVQLGDVYARSLDVSAQAELRGLGFTLNVNLVDQAKILGVSGKDEATTTLVLGDPNTNVPQLVVRLSKGMSCVNIPDSFARSANFVQVSWRSTVTADGTTEEVATGCKKIVAQPQKGCQGNPLNKFEFNPSSARKAMNKFFGSVSSYTPLPSPLPRSVALSVCAMLPSLSPFPSPSLSPFPSASLSPFPSVSLSSFPSPSLSPFPSPSLSPFPFPPFPLPLPPLPLPLPPLHPSPPPTSPFPFPPVPPFPSPFPTLFSSPLSRLSLSLNQSLPALP